MKASALLATTVICAYVPAAQAALHFTFTKHHNAGARGVNVNSSRASSDRRAATTQSINADTFYADVTYVVNATVGTPGQNVSLILSTSSADTWVVDARSDWCSYSTYYSYNDADDDDAYNWTTSDVESEYCIWGSFSAGNSSSFKLLDTNDDDDENYDYNYGFSDSYADGSYAYGSYMTDVLTLGGVPVSNLTMGIANDTSNFHGVLGIGFNDSTYDNLPDSLWKQELINSTAYSLWVDDEQASTGNLLFGAIDTAKFEGNLTRIASSAYNQMEVYVYGINSSASDGSSSKITFTDDTSTDYSDVYSYPFSASYSPPDSVSNFPTELASHIWDLAGAYYHEDISMAVILCSAQIDTSATLTIQLGPSSYYADVAAVTASLVDLIIPAQDYNLSSQYSYYLSSDDEDLCLFGVQNGSTHGTVDYSLGSTLLRRTYSVFDLANMEIAIAPINFEATTTTSSIVSFASYGATAPYASLYCSSYRCSDSSTSDSTNENGGGSDPLSGVLSLGGVLGLTLGLGLGFLALGLAGFLFWRQRWRRNNAVAPKATVSAGPISSGGEAGNAAPNMSMSGAAAGVSAGPEMTESSRGAPTASNQGNPTGEQSQHEGPTNTEADLGAHDVQAGPSSRP